MFKIAVLVSGNGTDLQSIIDAIKSGYIENCTIEAVISDRKGSFGIERAACIGIPTYVFERKIYKENLSDEICSLLQGRVDLIVLAGWLSILRGKLLKVFQSRIINIHPSLIPSFCGSGMYGIKVHEKVLQYGVKISGCTVHFVDEDTDRGPIIIQKSVPVLDDDTPQSLQKRVLEKEHIALPEAVKLISENKVTIQERKVTIRR